MTGRGSIRVELRRVYDHPDEGVHRVLVDRLWPRGIAKDDAPFDEWVKAVAPSTELRRWYGHDPAKFEEFTRRYLAELAQPSPKEAVARLRILAEKSGLVLVTATATSSIQRPKCSWACWSVRPDERRALACPGGGDRRIAPPEAGRPESMGRRCRRGRGGIIPDGSDPASKGRRQ